MVTISTYVQTHAIWWRIRFGVHINPERNVLVYLPSICIGPARCFIILEVTVYPKALHSKAWSRSEGGGSGALPPPCSCAAAPSQERVRTACTKRRLLLIISSNTSCIHLETTQREGIAKNCTQVWRMTKSLRDDKPIPSDILLPVTEWSGAAELSKMNSTKDLLPNFFLLTTQLFGAAHPSETYSITK